MKPMEFLGIDSRFSNGFLNNNKRKRGVKELPSHEAAAVSKKKQKIQNGIGERSEASSLESESESSGNHSSEIGAQPVGILVDGDGGGGDEEVRSFACVSHGSISVIGRRRSMEDTVKMVPGFAAVGEYDFFAVYDGHGGDRVAKACREKMHVLLAKEVEKWGRTGGGRGLDWEKVMMAGFEKMDEEVANNNGGDEEEKGFVLENMVGSTAVLVIVGKEEVVVANCGDSRAVLCRGGVAVPLSRDHKPDRPDERERVEAAGGRVVNWNGCRVLGVLATSRSIGDHYLRPYVISEPEVTVSERSESDEFLVIGSDGLWDVVSNEFACLVVGKCLDGQSKWRCSQGLRGSCAAEAATMLAELAMARGSNDNISVIVVKLRKSC